MGLRSPGRGRLRGDIRALNEINTAVISVEWEDWMREHGNWACEFVQNIDFAPVIGSLMLLSIEEITPAMKVDGLFFCLFVS